MNREIKFRAWLVNSERMLPNVYTVGPSDSPEHGVAEYMQFTGLQDANGVDIYEGDILKRLAPTQGTARHTTVVWRASGAGVGFNLRAPANTTRLRTMVVIGNIHENPELQA